MILVVGASGVLGREATRQLLAAGQRVRAASRSPERLRDLEALGAEAVRADLVDADSLRLACRGANVVLACAHSLMGTGRYASRNVDGDGHRALIDAAREAGVARFVYTSAMRASPGHPVDFMRTKADIERYLAGSGLDFVILRPSAFMEWHVHNLLGKGIVDTGQATIAGEGRNRINFVAAADVAAVAVAVVDDPRASRATLEIGGPDNVARSEIVALYERRLGRAARVRHVPLVAMHAMAMLLPPFKPVLARLMRMAAWTETSDQTFDPAKQPLPYPAPRIRVAEFVAERVPTTGIAAA